MSSVSLKKRGHVRKKRKRKRKGREILNSTMTLGTVVLQQSFGTFATVYPVANYRCWRAVKGKISVVCQNTGAAS
jgi:hypothetical protein